MTGALIILLVTVAVGLMLWVGDRRFRHHHSHSSHSSSHTDKAPQQESADNAADPTADNEAAPKSDVEQPADGICCGRHLICDKSLTPEPGESVVYYDDEELDRYAGRDADSYTDAEIEEFREIMTTMQPAELPGWARSLQLRGIQFPLGLRDELFMLIEEA